MKHVMGFLWVACAFGMAFWLNYSTQTLGEILIISIPSLIAAASLSWIFISHEAQQVWRKQEELKAISESYSKNAILSIERAYNVITENGERDGPVKDRLEWLTCSRWLAVAQRLAAKIEVQSIREIYEDEQEYWRTQFFDFFKPYDLHGFASNIDNFQESKLGAGDALEPRSVTILYKFIDWPEGRPDPIEEQPEYTEEEVANLGISKRGVRKYFGGEP